MQRTMRRRVHDILVVLPIEPSFCVWRRSRDRSQHGPCRWHIFSHSPTSFLPLSEKPACLITDVPFQGETQIQSLDEVAALFITNNGRGSDEHRAPVSAWCSRVGNWSQWLGPGSPFIQEDHCPRSFGPVVSVCFL